MPFVIQFWSDQVMLLERFRFSWPWYRVTFCQPCSHRVVSKLLENYHQVINNLILKKLLLTIREWLIIIIFFDVLWDDSKYCPQQPICNLKLCTICQVNNLRNVMILVIFIRILPNKLTFRHNILKCRIKFNIQ